MKTRDFSEQQSLELITQMIRQTRRNLDVGSGNLFLYYGYAAVVLSVVVFVAVRVTGNSLWAALWFLMFAVSAVIQWRSAKRKPQVVTYMDRAIGNTWSVVGVLFALTVVMIFVIGMGVGVVYFSLMLPLSLLYAGIGTAITGVITRVGALTYMPLVAFAVAIYMLIRLASGAASTEWWHLYFGVSFLAMMVVPGHVLNKKSLQSCSEN